MTSPSNQASELLRQRCAPLWAPSTVAAIVAELEALRLVPAVVTLLDELADLSPKLARTAIEALPELRARAGLVEASLWLDLSIAIGTSSGATALKFLKESPWLLALIEGREVRERVLRQTLELAEHDATVALEFLRAAPELARVIPADRLPAWIELGLELAERDYVLGPEFFRDCPKIAQAIPVEDARSWVGLGLRLVTTNQFGKTDYFATLEYLRTSPGLLQDIADQTCRRLVIHLAAAVAEAQPQAAVELLAEAPGLLLRIEDAAWQRRMLQYGLLVAEQDALSARDYLRRCPEVVRWLGYDEPARQAFEDWFKNGMEILAYSPEGARAYFALETTRALAAVQEAQSGVPLRQVARTISLFVQALCGRAVAVQELPEETQSSKQPARVQLSADGRTLYFPSLIRRHPERDRNARLYHVMAAHEAGHLEFGTYDLRVESFQDLAETVARRYGREQTPPPGSLADLFARYPQPGIIRDLWIILEDARVEQQLRAQYPGLREDLREVAQEAVTTRSLSQGMSVREMLLDGLLIRSAGIEPVSMPESIRDPLDRAWSLCRSVLSASATAEEAVRTADRVYVLFDTMVASFQVPPDSVSDRSGQTESHMAEGPRASEAVETEYRPLENWSFRGAMRPEFIGAGSADAQQRSGEPVCEQTDSADRPAAGRSSRGQSSEARFEERESVPIGADARPRGEADDQVATADTRRARWERTVEQARTFQYDEWDGMLQDYRTKWCRVVEDRQTVQNADVAEHILAQHGPAVRLLRRYFESIRPPALRLVRGVTDGEDIDLDAVVARRADLTAGAEPSDRIYVRRERRERDVAVAFVVDLSGSTSRQIDAGGQRVIDVEKAGLILLCEALEAIGDQYAIYGFSGKGRRQVDVAVLKEFGSTSRAETVARIGAVEPRAQNRDGAAIRHATRKLAATGARVRLLVLISDGKPLDDGYAEDYALEDTKMALREAIQRGIDPFCITVDREAEAYVRRMYGDVRYLVIDRVEGLPERLPRVYHSLTR